MSALFARILSASHLSRIGVTLVLILTALGVAYPLQPAQAASPLLPSISDFTSIGAGLPTGAYGAVAWGDYDNDGDLDFLFSGFNGSTDITRIYRNDGPAFTDIGAEFLGVSNGAADWGDYDRDGYLDLLLTGSDATTYYTKIFHNDGGVSFTDIAAELPGMDGNVATWGDYDNDGDLDILLSGTTTGLTGSYFTKIYQNNDAVFTDINAGLPSLDNNTAAWGDYDADGDLDLALTGNFTGRIFRNDNGVYTNIGVSLSNVSYGSLDWGDYDNDGDLDLLLTGMQGPSSYTRETKVFRYDGANNFTDINAGLYGVSNGAAAWGDYDNDGDLDILLSGYNQSGNVTKIYRYDGSSTFTDINAGLPANNNSAVAWGDYDNDGRLDFIVAGSSSSDIYHNNLSANNQPPAAPSGLSTSISGCSITFNWTASADDHTPSNGLTYNLRVGTSTGSGDVVSSNADTGTGYRRVVDLGNYQNGLSVTLRLPPNKTYYWSVQAIDSAFAGSAFASEQTVSAYAPAITYVDDNYTSATSGWACDHFSSLQTGIDAAASSGQVQVAAGTYVGTNLNRTVNVIVNGATTLSGPLSQSDGTFTGPTGALNISGLFTFSGGTFDAHTSVLTISSGLNQSDGVFTGPTGTFNLTGNLSLTGGTLNTANTTLNLNNDFIQNGGVFTAPVGTLSVKGNFTYSSGVYKANNGTLILNGNSAQTVSGSLPCYNLTINNTSASLAVDASGSALSVANLLRIQDGKLNSGGDLNHVQIDGAGVWQLSGDATISGNLAQNGSFVHNNYRLTFDGSSPQNLSASLPSVFWNLSVANGATLIETNPTAYVGIAGTLDNQGQIRKTQSIGGSNQYNFGLTGVLVNVTAPGTLSSLTVTYYGANHPGATGAAADSGTATGRYWDLTPTGSGYTLDLFLPHGLGANHNLVKACHYNTNWDCQRTSSDAGMVRLDGVTSLSPWADGVNVSPSYVGLVSFTNLPAPGLLSGDHLKYFSLGLLWANLIGMGLWGANRLRRRWLGCRNSLK